MEYVHKVQSEKINLSSAVSRHSADETVVYKTVDGQPYYLGFFFPENYEKANTYPAFVFIHGGGWSEKRFSATSSTSRVIT